MKVGYCRVSTTQSAQDTSFDEQARQLRQAGCDEVISERRSAYKGTRPEWDRLWALVGSGRVSEVLVIDQSRLSRSGDDMAFLEACSLRGVTVRALVGGIIEVESYGGFVAAGVISVLNRADSKLKAAKVRDGLRRRREQGLYACGKVPFGYAVQNGLVVPHPVDHAAARLMWEQLHAAEMNVSGWVKQHSSTWTPKGIRQWLRNPILRGTVRDQLLATTPLITFEEWRSTEAMLEKRKGMRGTAAHNVHLFTGLVRCEQCGKSLHNIIESGRRKRLKCKNRVCAWFGRGIRVSQVREQVIAALTTRYREMAALGR